MKRIGTYEIESLAQKFRVETLEVNATEPIHVKESVRQLGVDQALYEKGNELLVISDFGEKAKQLLDEDKISEGHYNELINMISNGLCS